MSRQQLRADIRNGIDELDAGQGIDGERVFAELQRRSGNVTNQAG